MTRQFDGKIKIFHRENRSLLYGERFSATSARFAISGLVLLMGKENETTNRRAEWIRSWKTIPRILIHCTASGQYSPSLSSVRDFISISMAFLQPSPSSVTWPDALLYLSASASTAVRLNAHPSPSLWVVMQHNAMRMRSTLSPPTRVHIRLVLLHGLLLSNPASSAISQTIPS